VKPRDEGPLKAFALAACLAATWVLVILIFLTPEAPNSRGVPHSKVTEMDQGGDGIARHKSVKITGALLGGVMLALFVILLAWGTHPSSPVGARWIGFVLGGLLYISVFAMMCIAYGHSITETEAAFIGPFPAGLGWMLFGLWPIPSFFIGLYVFFFDSWIFPSESERGLAELAKQRPGRGP